MTAIDLISHKKQSTRARKMDWSMPNRHTLANTVSQSAQSGHRRSRKHSASS